MGFVVHMATKVQPGHLPASRQSCRHTCCSAVTASVSPLLSLSAAGNSHCTPGSANSAGSSSLWRPSKATGAPAKLRLSSTTSGGSCSAPASASLAAAAATPRAGTAEMAGTAAAPTWHRRPARTKQHPLAPLLQLTLQAFMCMCMAGISRQIHGTCKAQASQEQQLQQE